MYILKLRDANVCKTIKFSISAERRDADVRGEEKDKMAFI